MNLFELLGINRKKTAQIARERLQIVVSHQRLNNSEKDFLPKLRQDLLEVIGKYVPIQKDQITVQLQRDGNHSILELNVTLPSTVAS